MAATSPEMAKAVDELVNQEREPSPDEDELLQLLRQIYRLSQREPVPERVSGVCVRLGNDTRYSAPARIKFCLALGWLFPRRNAIRVVSTRTAERLGAKLGWTPDGPVIIDGAAAWHWARIESLQRFFDLTRPRLPPRGFNELRAEVDELTDVGAMRRRAEKERAAGSLKRAAVIVERVYSLTRSETDALALAALLRRTDETAEAARLLVTLLQRMPDEVQAKATYTAVMALYRKHGSREALIEAETIGRRLVEVAPDDQYVNNALAGVLVDLGRDDEAGEFFGYQGEPP